MSDITIRLRRWAIATDAVPASDLMDEAAVEIERLRDHVDDLLCAIETAGYCYRNTDSGPNLVLPYQGVTKPLPKEIRAEVSSHPTSDRIYVSSTDTPD